MTSVDHYAVLGVAPKASAQDIKKAYRTLAKRHHADHGGDGERMIALNQAYEVLGNADRRRAWDRERAARTRREKPAPGRPAAQPRPSRPSVPDPVELEIAAALRLYQQGDLEAAALAIEKAWTANSSSLSCGRARAVIALKFAASLLADDELDTATAWLEAACETMARFDALRDEDTLLRTAGDLRGRIAAHRAAQARQAAEAAAAVEAERERQRLAEEALAQRRHQQEQQRKAFVAVWLLASLLTYIVVYQASSASQATAGSAKATATTRNTPFNPAAARARR